MRYQVFIERTKDPAAAAIVRTAAAIAARFGLPAQDLAHRLAAGRFRVKSGVERDAAERLVSELEAMGAVCSIADEAGNAVQLGMAAPARASERAPSVMPSAAAPPGAARARSSGELQSGLAAALAASTSEPDLGALGASAAPLSLATLDGEEDAPPPVATSPRSFVPASFAPPPEHEQDLQLAVDIRKPKVALSSAAEQSASRSSAAETESLGPAIVGVAIPPGLEQSNTELVAPAASGSMAVIRTPVERRGSSPRPMIMTTPLAARAGGATSASGAENPALRAMSLITENPRARFIAGVLLALFLGFVPAHMIASMREDSAFAEIDATVRAAQANVVDLDDWNRLDETRAMLLARKQTKQRNIALSSMVLWAMVGGGIAYGWSRKFGY